MAAAGAARAQDSAKDVVDKVVKAAEASEDAPIAINTAPFKAALQEAEVAVKAAAAAAADSPGQGAKAKGVEKLVEEAASALKDAAAAATQEASAGSAAEQTASAASVSSDLGQASQALKQAAQAAKGAGADTDVLEALQNAVTAISGAASTAQEMAEPALRAAQPAVKQAVSFLASTDPAVLAEYALGVVAIGYVLPPLLKKSLEAARGYAGDVQPTAALDALVSQGGNVLVDIRSAKDKEAAGVPDLADPTKLVELEFVAVENQKLYQRLRNATDVEAESTAIQIAALKKLSRGNTLYLLDSNGTVARAVAKELAKRGFSRAFVINGGCQAWVAAKLRTRNWNAAAAMLPEKSGVSM